MCQPFKNFLKLLMRLTIMHPIMCIPFFCHWTFDHDLHSPVILGGTPFQLLVDATV